MELLLKMDEHNYAESMPEIKREAVRGIILQGHKLLMTETKIYNEVNFPVVA